VEDGLVFQLSKGKEPCIRMIILISFVDANIVRKQTIGIGMICGKIITVEDYKMKKGRRKYYRKRSSIHSRIRCRC
jgi:hypothetical protein